MEESELRDRLTLLLREDSDLDHRPILDDAVRSGLANEATETLLAFLRETPATSSRDNVLLLQERAILVLGDLLWHLKAQRSLPGQPAIEALLQDVSASPSTRAAILAVLDEAAVGAPSEDAYLAFINQFLAAANEREMLDFALAKDGLRQRLTAPDAHGIGWRPASRRLEALVPMRVGISSANASDNWTFSKLRGGSVVNFAVDLAPGPDKAPQPPIRVMLSRTDEPGLFLETRSHLDTARPTTLRLDAGNARDFLAIPPSAPHVPSACFKDVGDPLLLLQSYLVFSGIIPFHRDGAAYVTDPARVLGDVGRFADGGGLTLVVQAEGPSRAGFASSSCVALGLLRVLFEASGQTAWTEGEALSSMALLLENEVGLKSGKQDTDGPLYPGVKSITYRPTTGFLTSEVTPIHLDEDALAAHVVLVNSGIERPPAIGLKRGLNMRHFAYISRDPRGYPAILRSLDVHTAIVEALGASDWARLGVLFDEYLDLRETIDPGATQSVHDVAAGTKVLRVPFEALRSQGMIHGGMYTGAMGGGCMMLVATPAGLEREAGRTRLEAAIERLRDLRLGESRPLSRLALYRYAVNNRGLICSAA